MEFDQWVSRLQAQLSTHTQTPQQLARAMVQIVNDSARQPEHHRIHRKLALCLILNCSLMDNDPQLCSLTNNRCYAPFADLTSYPLSGDALFLLLDQAQLWPYFIEAAAFFPCSLAKSLHELIVADCRSARSAGLIVGLSAALVVRMRIHHEGPVTVEAAHLFRKMICSLNSQPMHVRLLVLSHSLRLMLSAEIRELADEQLHDFFISDDDFESPAGLAVRNCVQPQLLSEMCGHLTQLAKTLTMGAWMDLCEVSTKDLISSPVCMVGPVRSDQPSQPSNAQLLIADAFHRLLDLRHLFPEANQEIVNVLGAFARKYKPVYELEVQHLTASDLVERIASESESWKKAAYMEQLCSLGPPELLSSAVLQVIRSNAEYMASDLCFLDKFFQLSMSEEAAARNLTAECSLVLKHLVSLQPDLDGVRGLLEKQIQACGAAASPLRVPEFEAEWVFFSNTVTDEQVDERRFYWLAIQHPVHMLQLLVDEAAVSAVKTAPFAQLMALLQDFFGSEDDTLVKMLMVKLLDAQCRLAVNLVKELPQLPLKAQLFAAAFHHLIACPVEDIEPVVRLLDASQICLSMVLNLSDSQELCIYAYGLAQLLQRIRAAGLDWGQEAVMRSQESLLDMLNTLKEKCDLCTKVLAGVLSPEVQLYLGSPSGHRPLNPLQQLRTHYFCAETLAPLCLDDEAVVWDTVLLLAASLPSMMRREYEMLVHHGFPMDKILLALNIMLTAGCCSVASINYVLQQIGVAIGLFLRTCRPSQCRCDLLPPMLFSALVIRPLESCPEAMQLALVDLVNHMLPQPSSSGTDEKVHLLACLSQLPASFMAAKTMAVQRIVTSSAGALT